VTGNFHYTPTSTTRNYYDEEIIDRDGPFIIYQLGTQCESIFKNAADRFPTGINIVGFSQENFKRFYKLPKVRQLTDCLYNVAFGDLFTDLGKTCLPESVRKEIQKLYTKEKHHTAFLVHLFTFK
jgi:hypothetical protein